MDMILFFNGKLHPKPLEEHHVHKPIIPQSRRSGSAVFSYGILRWEDDVLRQGFGEQIAVLQLRFLERGAVRRGPAHVSSVAHREQGKSAPSLHSPCEVP